MFLILISDGTFIVCIYFLINLFYSAEIWIHMNYFTNNRAKEKRLRRDASRQNNRQNEDDVKILQREDIDDDELDEENEIEMSSMTSKSKTSTLYVHSQTYETSFLTNSSSIDSGAESEGELSNSSIPHGKIPLFQDTEIHLQRYHWFWRIYTNVSKCHWISECFMTRENANSCRPENSCSC